MSRSTANPTLVWVALHGWIFVAGFGLLFLLGGGLWVEESWNAMMVIGAVLLFVVAPLSSLARFLMPRSWKRSMSRRGNRRV